MPTYEYACQQCGRRFEAFQSMSDDPVEHCPDCGGRVERLIGGGAAVIFKGSGFYATDYKTAGSPADRCRKDGPCCGREVPCTDRPCD